MKASPLEYRYRYLIHALIYIVGFYAPIERHTSFSLGASSWWLLLAAFLAREQWLSFTAASRLLLVLGCVAAVAGAWLRIWGASYLGFGVVQSGTMHGGRLLADGPFRHVRNPLYLGTICNTVALSLLMKPTGAIVTLVLIVIVQVRLVGAEEAFLPTRFGAAYKEYCALVPRFLPSLRARVAAGGATPRYLAGTMGELFVLGTAISFVALGGSYNTTWLLKGILISFGASLVARAFAPGVQETERPGVSGG